jgi:hypothetical protein
MKRSSRTSRRDHDLRMHLGVILMALQMINRPPAAPLPNGQQELVDIMKRAAKAMETILKSPPKRSARKTGSGHSKTG